MPDLRPIERLWWSGGVAARLARTALLPLELGYRSVVLTRGAFYDRGIFRTQRSPIPVISVGNLTVGGTGKTPIAAWIVSQLLEQGARPAVVLRGYGDDEPLVHRALNPEAPVIVSPDRVLGIAEAAHDGATMAVLDDGFQHRRAGRSADIVLVSADRWDARRRLIPAGPWREPISAARRASLVLVTRKAVGRIESGRVLDEMAVIASAVPRASVHLSLGELREVHGDDHEPVQSLAGAKVLAVAAVGDPRAFIRQLSLVGAQVRFSLFPDHHPFTPEDAYGVASSLEDDERVVCTLKDAVKLAPIWPRDAGPLWYVSQQVVVEAGADALESLLTAVLRLRAH